jgi:hypothetical protein
VTAREQLHAEIDALDDRSVASVSEFVRQIVKSQAPKRSGDLLTMLRQVQIDGPVDFSENLDLYMNGGKSVSDDVH